MRAAATFVLRHHRGAAAIAVLAVARAFSYRFNGGEGALASTLRAPQKQAAKGAERAGCELGSQPALRKTQLVVRRAGDGVVTLARIKRSFDDA